MTVDVPDQETTTPPPQQRGSRGRLWLLASIPFLATGLAVVGLVVWHNTASTARAHVTASLNRPITCIGTSVVQTDLEPGGTTTFIPVVKPRPGMLCTLQVRYANGGSHTVHLSSATYGYLGRDTGGLMTISGPGLAIPRHVLLNVDAHFDLDRDLFPGDAFVATYQLHFQLHSCSAGITSSLDEPRLEVSSLGLSGEVYGDVPIAWSGLPRCSH